MTEVPKIVYDRLRAAVPERAHPDVDLLSAFAEQALSATEREGVLQHLALCGDCRWVAAAVLLGHPRKQNQATPPSPNSEIATTAPPASGLQAPTSSVPSSRVPL